MSRVTRLLICGCVLALSSAGCTQKPENTSSQVPKAAFKADLSKMSAADRQAMATAMHSKPQAGSK